MEELTKEEDKKRIRCEETKEDGEVKRSTTHRDREST